MKFKEKQLWIGDYHLSYLDEGKHEGIPLIFIHGFPFNKWTWENQIEVCSANHRAIAFDIRGHGNSTSKTGGVSIASLTEDLFRFMDALQIKKATVCGLSMGGYIALNAMKQQPERIAALILCDTQCTADSEVTKKKRIETVDMIRKNGLADYTRDSLPKLLSEHTLANKKEVVAFIEQTILQTPVETICNTLVALADRKETCSSLPLISIPVLIIVGEADLITPPNAAQHLHKHIRNSFLQIIDNAGHLSNLENPLSFNAVLQRFLGIEAKAMRNTFGQILHT
jgi:3-oxoadipate enol-lactonase